MSELKVRLCFMPIKRRSQRFHSHGKSLSISPKQFSRTACTTSKGAAVLSFIRLAFAMTEQVKKITKIQISFPTFAFKFITISFQLYASPSFCLLMAWGAFIAQMIRHHRMTTSDKMQHKKHSKRTSASPSLSLVLRKCFSYYKRYPICRRVCWEGAKDFGPNWITEMVAMRVFKLFLSFQVSPIALVS